jgi:hypothetical protein
MENYLIFLGPADNWTSVPCDNADPIFWSIYWLFKGILGLEVGLKW